MALLFTCALILAACAGIGEAAGSAIGGLVAGAAVCIGVIWELGA